MSNNSISENESRLLYGDGLPVSLLGGREPCDARQPVPRGVGRIAAMAAVCTVPLGQGLVKAVRLGVAVPTSLRVCNRCREKGSGKCRTDSLAQ